MAEIKSDEKKIILIGAGGHSRSVIDSIKGKNEYDIAGILDVAEKVGTILDGVEVIGTDEDMKAYFNKGIKYAFLSLGSIGDTSLRRKLYQKMTDCGFILPNIIDPSAVVAGSAKLAQGIFIGKNAVINAGTLIGEGCIVNTGAIVEHDCRVGDFVHLATGSILCGNVRVGQDTHIGAGATVIQGIDIGENVLIGAGSVVVSNIQDGMIAFGSPCRKQGEKTEG